VPGPPLVSLPSDLMLSLLHAVVDASNIIAHTRVAVLEDSCRIETINTGYSAAMGPVESHCPECGQRLLLDSASLRSHIRCPRCNTKHAVAALVSLETPIHAARASDPEEAVAVVAAQQSMSPSTSEPMQLSAASVARPVEPSTAPVVLSHANRNADDASDSVDRFGVAAEHAGAFAEHVLDLSLRVDRLLDGRRAPALFATSMFACFAAFWKIVGDSDVLAWVAVAAWSGLVIVLLVARVDRLRDDYGWRLSYVWIEVRDGFLAAVEAIARTAQLRGAARKREIGRLLCMIGVLTSPVVLVVDVWEASDISILPLPLLTVISGAVLWWNSGGRPSVGRGSHSLSRAPADGSDAELRTLLSEIEAWRPRFAGTEREYQRRLLWRLKRSMPDAFPEEERWIENAEGERVGRVDILVSDRIVIEMKARPGSSGADRAIGQVNKYADYCLATGTGPVVLVLCDTEEREASRITETLNAYGKPVHVVRV
jgi:hypothetical protein